ncbi:SDR family oxidoreductase [Pontibacter silvestris]|uniref:SDR family oxidoreductase n=1 Tax=Pontibacter silvestris TaxID=2305183 RepID=A0ABW4WW17_9BACT|nr:SDR family oxidoreductase [Pontibacter silvestris]MCC9137418.1 SDR family oxidoreductase [Pontibacter silvestris]
MNLKLKPLKEQVIVLTGASSGIGLTTARMAAKEGAKLVLAARNEDALDKLVQEIRHNGGQAIFVGADVGIEEDVMRIAEAAIATFGGFDTWANIAGVSIFGHCLDVSIPDMKHMFDTNFWGVVYGSRIAANHFIKRGSPGAVINVGSFFGNRAAPIQSTYSASKYALHGWTDALRMELEKDKAPVSVTLIHPGRIDTPYNEHARSYMDRQPEHRGMVYVPDTVADAILYAAATPKRDMFVGFQSKFFTVMAAISPRLMDKVMEVIMYPTQLANRPSRDVEDNALYKPGYGMHERGTNVGWIRSGSVYVQAQKHPAVATLAVAGLGAAIAFLAGSRNRNKKF